MPLRISTAAQNAAANAIAALADAGAGAGTIKVYTGSQPTTANDTETGTLLATFTLNDAAFAAASSGQCAYDVTPAVSTTGAAAGTAGWYRLEDSTGANIMDGSVTATGGGGQMELNTTTISVGVTVSITSGSFTVPAA